MVLHHTASSTSINVAFDTDLSMIRTKAQDLPLLLGHQLIYNVVDTVAGNQLK